MKSKTLLNAIKITCVYIGTVIGAGFASGQEMMQFFVKYGNKGMFGLIITGMLFGIIGTIILQAIYEENLSSFHELSVRAMGKTLSWFMEIIVTLFMFICFCAMFAGAGALFAQWIQLPYYFGVAIIGVLCFITFLFNVEGVVFVNTILAPILLVGFIVISVYMWSQKSSTVFYAFGEAEITYGRNWISSSFAYVSYNILSAAVVLGSLRYLVENDKVAKLTGLLTGFSLTLIGLLIGSIILFYYQEVKQLEIPLFAIASRFSPVIQIIYMIIFLSAIFTTAIACGFCVIEKVSGRKQLKKKKIIVPFILILSAALISRIGFSTLVKDVYPIFGAIGLFEVLMITFYYFSRFKKN